MPTLYFVHLEAEALKELQKKNSNFMPPIILPPGHWFVQCRKNGVHKEISKIKRIWHAHELLKRFNDGKQTKIISY